ncbi:hypothetical protein [Limnohabitans sp. B9-3]|uniref:hypothetical protein n=1 Tax=Limnohabitans sp. B9-3 TaxID=1100707 RepID=UPI00117BDC08|nr:hypothetical protein [Limnohabitans sp. B9-3]
MFSGFFEKKDMERVVWHILSSYKNLFCDPAYNTDEREPENVLMESAIFGALLYANEKKLNESDFYTFYIQGVAEHIEETGSISLEAMCFIAASLRGDFSKNIRNIGTFFGESVRMLNLGVGAFEKYPMSNSVGLKLIGKTTLLRFLSAKNKR